MASTQKTQPTDRDPAEYCASLPTERRRSEGARLLDIFARATDERAVMWGPSMIGYGPDAYTYSSGHSGEWFRVGFSPRAAAISLYGLAMDATDPLFDSLGKHRRTVGCVYVNGLKDIDEAVLERIIRLAWESPRPTC